jgi:hypothetical protein
MAKQNGLAFTVMVDRSVKLNNKATGAMAATIGAAAASELARLDLGDGLTFVPRKDWPGGWILRIEDLASRERLEELTGGRP